MKRTAACPGPGPLQQAGGDIQMDIPARCLRFLAEFPFISAVLEGLSLHQERDLDRLPRPDRHGVSGPHPQRYGEPLRPPGCMTAWQTPPPETTCPCPPMEAPGIRLTPSAIPTLPQTLTTGCRGDTVGHFVQYSEGIYIGGFRVKRLIQPHDWHILIDGIII